MPYLVLGVALVVGGVLLVRGLSGTDPKVVLKVLRWTVIGLGAGLILFLVLAKQLQLAAYLLFGLVPFFLRWRALGRLARSFRGPSPGQSSDVETRYLRMRLDHDSGELEGTILEGEFKGRRLAELGAADLLSLLAECRIHDEQSATILETYLDRVHGPEWRAADAGGSSGGRAASGGAMTIDEAYEILGLQPGATAAQIREAHRALMQKNHPDHGGSTYLAAKINEAKELLLGGK